jgi:LPS sulfotransferase NodH
MIPALSYFVCTLPRSGSWLLCESLEKTGIAGRPREYFEPKLFDGDSKGVSPEAMETILAKGTTANQIFSAKLHWYQFEFITRLTATNGGSDRPVPLLMEDRFPGLRYIWLIRRDKTRQAISYYRASETGQWWKIPNVNAEQTPPTPSFNFSRIQYLERVLIDHESKWQKYFEENNIDPLVLVYEELAEDPASAIAEVLKLIGVSGPAYVKPRPRLLRQSDSLTDEWVERYIALKDAQKVSNG